MTNKDDRAPSDELDELDAFLAGLAPSSPGAPRPLPISSPNTPRPVGSSLPGSDYEDDEGATQIGQIPQELLAALGRRPAKQRAVTLPPPAEDTETDPDKFSTAPPPAPEDDEDRDTAPPPAPVSLPPPAAHELSWEDDFELDTATLPPPPLAKEQTYEVDLEDELSDTAEQANADVADDPDARPTLGFDTPLSFGPSIDLDDPFAPPIENSAPMPFRASEVEVQAVDVDISVDDDDEILLIDDDDEPLLIDTSDDYGEISIETDDEPQLIASDDDEISIEISEDEDERATVEPPARHVASADRREPIVSLHGRAQFEARSKLVSELAEKLEGDDRARALVAAAELAERAGNTARAATLLELASPRSSLARRTLARLGRGDVKALLADDLGGDVAALESASHAVDAVKAGDERAALAALDEAWTKANDPALRVLLASAGADLARDLGDTRAAASMRLRAIDEASPTGVRVSAARELIELGDLAAASDLLLVAAENEERVQPSDALRRIGRRLAGRDPESISSLVASEMTARAAARRGDLEVERAALTVVESMSDGDDRARATARLATLDALSGSLETATRHFDDARKLASRSAHIDALRDALAIHLRSPERFSPTPLHREEDAPLAALGRALSDADASEETIAALEAVRSLGGARNSAERILSDVAASLGNERKRIDALASEAASNPVGPSGLSAARALVVSREAGVDEALRSLPDDGGNLAEMARAFLLAKSDRDGAANALGKDAEASVHERHLRARLASALPLEEIRALSREEGSDLVLALRLEQEARVAGAKEVEAEALARLSSLSGSERDRAMLRLLTASVGGGAHADLELAPNDPILLAEALLSTKPNEATLRRALEVFANDSSELVRALLLARSSSLAETERRREDASMDARSALEVAPDDASIAASVELAELGAEQSTRIAHRLFSIARGDGDFRARARAYARLSELDRRELNDATASFASLNETAKLAPSHIPTLRALEVLAFENGDIESLRSIEPALALALAPGSARDAHARLAIRTIYGATADITADLAQLSNDLLERPTSSTRLLRWIEHAGRDSNEALDLVALERRLLLATHAAERIELLLRVASVAERRGNAERTLAALDEALSIEPGHPVALLERAILLDAGSDDREAANAHEAAAASSVSVNRATYHHLRASARLLAQGTLDEALAILDAAKEADPASAEILLALTEVHERRNDLESALRSITARIELGGTNDAIVAAHNLRGRLAERVGEATIAREAYAAVLASSPEDPRVLRRAADLAIAASDGRSAVDLLIRLARLERGRDELRRIFLELGDSYERLVPDARRAEASFRRVLQLEPTHAHANARLVAVLCSASRHDDALVVADQLDEAKPGDSLPMQLRTSIARHLEDSGNARRAEQLLENLRRTSPTHAPLILEIAEFYSRQGAKPALAMHLNRSATDLRRAFEAAPTRATLECLLAVQRRRGRPELFACASAAAAALGLAVDDTGTALVKQIEPLARAVKSEEIDDLVAPAILTPSTRAAVRLASDAIERAFPFDPRPFKVEKISREASLKTEAKLAASWFGFDDVQIYVTPVAPRICVPVSGNPLTIIIGSELSSVSTPDERAFLFVRAAKIAAAGLSFAMRLTPDQLGAVLHGLVRSTSSDYSPPKGVDRAAVEDAASRLAKHLPKGDLHALCLEMGSRPEFVPDQFGVAAAEWADRIALLATGRPAPALSGLHHLGGQDFVRAGFDLRIELLRRMPEAFDLLLFALSDMHPDARSRGSRT